MGSAVTTNGTSPQPPIRIHVGVPTFDNRINAGIFTALTHAIRAPNSCVQMVQIQSGSWLARNFNACFAMALNGRASGITHFLMLHEDLVPQSPGWLAQMVQIAAANKADILSVVSPFKYEKGLTSTALDEPGRIRRLTLHEIYNDFKPTFTAPNLLINTGCMLVDLRKKEFETLRFTMQDSIEKNADGRYVENGCPEDWLFSRDARKFGASIWATREIHVIHFGGGQFGNMSAWGTLLTDKKDESPSMVLRKA